MSYSTRKNQRKRDIIGSLNNKMLSTSLWGVLDITLHPLRYEIIEVVSELVDNHFYKEEGFSLKLIDGMNFVQKVPYFDGNDEFIEKYDLYIGDRPSYQSYLAHMAKEQKKYADEII